MSDERLTAMCRYLLLIEIMQFAVAAVNVAIVVITLIGYQRIVGAGFRQFMN